MEAFCNSLPDIAQAKQAFEYLKSFELYDEKQIEEAQKYFDNIDKLQEDVKETLKEFEEKKNDSLFGQMCLKKMKALTDILEQNWNNVNDLTGAMQKDMEVLKLNLFLDKKTIDQTADQELLVSAVMLRMYNNMDDNIQIAPSKDTRSDKDFKYLKKRFQQKGIEMVDANTLYLSVKGKSTELSNKVQMLVDAYYVIYMCLYHEENAQNVQIEFGVQTPSAADAEWLVQYLNKKGFDQVSKSTEKIGFVSIYE